MKQDQSKAFYEQKGMVRRTVIMTKEHIDKLRALAKKFVLTQGEVIEVLLDNVENVNGGKFIAKRVIKGDSKVLVKKLKNLSPEKLAQIEALIGE
jgi:hypothetical protein